MYSMDRDPQPSMDRGHNKRLAKIIGLVVGAIVIIVVISLVFGAFGFMMQKVDTNEVGLITKAGRPVELVGPGVYSRWGPFSYYDIELVSTSAVAFCAEDREVLTTADEDQNPIRIGVKVCGDIFRPGLEVGFERFATLFTKYRTLYLSDEPLIGYLDGDIYVEGLAQAKGQQAMKSCIGDQNLFGAAVGSSRNETAACHEGALNKLFDNYGFVVGNVTVPNISIPESYGVILDQIGDAQAQTQAANELAELARAQADQRQAEREGDIRVAQAETQERLRQNILTASLEKQSVDAQLEVIKAVKTNELEEQVLNLAIVEAAYDVAIKDAEIALAQEAVLVSLYADNPEYMRHLEGLANAAAFGEADKLILPAGTIPKAVISPDGEVATVVSPEE